MVVGNNPLSETSECHDSSQAQVTDFEEFVLEENIGIPGSYVI